jgi:hypothetical protein
MSGGLLNPYYSYGVPVFRWLMVVKDISSEAKLCYAHLVDIMRLEPLELDVNSIGVSIGISDAQVLSALKELQGFALIDFVAGGEGEFDIEGNGLVFLTHECMSNNGNG